MAEHEVLIVDDDPGILSVLKSRFRSEPYRLTTVQSCDEAMALLAEKKIHVIVADERMPQTSGSTFLREVKRLYPHTLRLILTGIHDVDDILLGIEAGDIHMFLTKPCDILSLAMIVRQHIEAEIKKCDGSIEKAFALLRGLD